MFTDDVFQEIINCSIFMEKATFSMGDNEYAIHGFFSSGTFSYASNVAYAPKDFVPEEHFMASLIEFQGIDKPWESLKGINDFTIEGRGTFRIKNIDGVRSGMVNLTLDKARVSTNG